MTMTGATLPVGEERTCFSYVDYCSGEWRLITREGVKYPLAALVGLVVNIGTKDGLVYEGTRVTALDERAGRLTVEGGPCGRPFFEPGEADPVDEPEEVPAWDIARGFVHPRDAQDPEC